MSKGLSEGAKGMMRLLSERREKQKHQSAERARQREDQMKQSDEPGPDERVSHSRNPMVDGGLQ